MNRRGVLLSLLLLSSALIIVFSIPSESFARREQIELVHTGTDPIGNRIGYQAREILQTSATLGSYDGKDMIWTKIVLMTISTNKDQENHSSCYSVVIVSCLHDVQYNFDHEYYFGSWVGICGLKMVRETAEDIVASVSKLLPVRLNSQPK
jgi:hypothetical protein